MFNWLKTHPRFVATLIGSAFVGAGIIALVPHSPWTLIVIGCIILIAVLSSFVDDMPL